MTAYSFLACDRLLPMVGLKENAEGRPGGSRPPMLSGVKISHPIKFSHKHKIISVSSVSTVQCLLVANNIP